METLSTFLASALCQLPPALHTMSLEFDVWSPVLLCGWPDGLKHVTRYYAIGHVLLTVFGIL